MFASCPSTVHTESDVIRRGYSSNKIDKAISMMRGKSPVSELILEIIKSNNSLSF